MKGRSPEHRFLPVWLKQEVGFRVPRQSFINLVPSFSSSWEAVSKKCLLPATELEEMLSNQLKTLSFRLISSLIKKQTGSQGVYVLIFLATHLPSCFTLP